MANAVRQICTKIGNGHQFLLSTAKTSAYGCHVISDSIHQRLIVRYVISHDINRQPLKLTAKSTIRIYRKYVSRFQIKPNPVDTLFRQSQNLCYIGEPFNNKQSIAAAVWFKSNDRNANTKSENFFKSTSNDINNTLLDSKGQPSAEQLDYVYNKLGENVCI